MSVKKQIKTALFRGTIWAILISLFTTGIALAAYTSTITLTNSSATAYTMVGANVTANIDYMADNGFFADSEGLDTRVYKGTAAQKHMLADDRIMIATAIPATSSQTLSFTTGNSDLSTFPVIVGNGGYITVADSDSLELSDKFTLSYDGYFDATKSGNYTYKQDAIQVYGDGAGNVTADLYSYEEQLLQSTGLSLYTGAYTRGGENITSMLPGDFYKASFYLKKVGSPTGNASIVLRNASTDAVIGTLDTIDVATLTTDYVWYDFDGSITNPKNQGVLVLVEYAGGGASDYISVGYQGTDVYANGNFAGYIAGYAPFGAADCAFKYNMINADLTVSGVSSGDKTITVDRDTPFFGISDTTTDILPASDNLTLNVPFWQTECNDSSFTSIDDNELTVVVTGAVWGSSGYAFDSGAGDVITISDNALLDITDDLTIEGWIYLNNIGGNDSLLGKVATIWSELSFTLQIYNTGWVAFNTSSDGTISTMNELRTSYGLVADNWYHVVATFGRPQKYIYINAVEQADGIWDNDIYSGTSDLYIGKYAGNSDTLDGKIGEFRIYNRALSPTEIQQNFNATKWKYGYTVDRSVYSTLASVPDNLENITMINNNIMPYADNITWSVGGVTKLVYAPNTILEDIDGSTANLTDTSGNGNWGTITWGSNPANVNLVMSSLESDYSVATVDVTQTQDVLKSTSVNVMSEEDAVRLASMQAKDPVLYPLFNAFNNVTSIPVMMMYEIFFMALAIIVMMFVGKFGNMTLIVGAGWVILGAATAWGVYDWWLMLVLIIVGLGLILTQGRQMA